MEGGWKEHLNEHNTPGDLDALLRLVEVAQHYGAKKSRLIKLLKAAADQRLALAVQLANGLGGIRGGPFSYCVTRAKVELERLQAEKQALTDIADALEKRIVRRTVEKPTGDADDGQIYFFPELRPDQPKRPRKRSE